MTRLRSLILMFVAAGALTSGCRLFNPSVMLRTGRDYPYAVPTDTVPSEHIIQSGDLLMFRLFSNEGFKIIDMTMLENGPQALNLQGQNQLPYRVEADGAVNLPIIGRTMVAGMDLKEAELYLEDKYRNYYNEPFVVMSVNNRRVVIFPGEGGAAKVISITNEYTTIIEVLAMVGGISRGGKAHRIKVIRGDLNDPEIYKMDLSTAEGLAEANMYYVEANDIIYVEPSYFVGNQIITTTTQILGVISSTILTYVLVAQFSNNSGQ